jgi:hypothetical protein
VQVFRRSKAETPSEGYRIRPKGLNPKASYTVTDVDMPSQSSQVSGDVLMREGLEVSFPQKPQSALFLLQKK